MSSVESIEGDKKNKEEDRREVLCSFLGMLRLFFFSVCLFFVFQYIAHSLSEIQREHFLSCNVFLFLALLICMYL